MKALFDWFMAGTPAHWLYCAAVMYALCDFVLGESKKIQANSVLKALFNAGQAFFGRALPAAWKAMLDKALTQAPPQ